MEINHTSMKKINISTISSLGHTFTSLVALGLGTLPFFRLFSLKDKVGSKCSISIHGPPILWTSPTSICYYISNFAQHHSLSEICKSKPLWGTISHQSEWLQSKSLQVINAGEGVEKREPSYTVGGNAN